MKVGRRFIRKPNKLNENPTAIGLRKEVENER
jgi:hypothetical protein